MSIGDYLRDKQGQLLLHLAGMLALSVFLLVTGTSWGVVCLLLIVWAAGLFAVSAITFVRRRRELAEAWAILDGLPQKYLLMECLPRPRSSYARQWHELMKKAGKSMIESVSAAQRDQREYREYIENWVHEVKVPITAAQLVCKNNPGGATRKLLPQLAQIEEQVERALFYARSGQIERDFVVRRVPLAAPVEAALAKYQALLIPSGVRVEAEALDAAVYTDAKWLEFIIGQLLSNAVKYRGEQPVITISAASDEEGTTLTVADNGIGLPAAELPRVFDKGFTGSNGRARGGATGMGLYLCKKLSDHLDIRLVVESAENEYTRVSLRFPQGGDPAASN